MGPSMCLIYGSCTRSSPNTWTSFTMRSKLARTSADNASSSAFASEFTKTKVQLIRGLFCNVPSRFAAGSERHCRLDWRTLMRRLAASFGLLLVTLIGCTSAPPAAAPVPAPQLARPAPPWPAFLPRYDHILIVVEENKDFEQVVGNPAASYLNRLAAEGALLTHMFGEEHNSEGNYFWLFSGNNHGVGFKDVVPKVKFTDANLGAALIAKGLMFKGYSQSLPAIGSEIDVTPPGCHYPCLYGRKHVPWVSFANVPNGPTPETSSNLRFADFPT